MTPPYPRKKTSDIVRNNTLVMSSESDHIMPQTRVMNLCSSDYPLKVEEIMYHEELVLRWAKFRPKVTVLQIGTIDLVMGSLGEDPPQQSYWKAIRKFCLQMPEMAMSCIDTHGERETFRELMSAHYFIILPPLDFIHYENRP